MNLPLKSVTVPTAALLLIFAVTGCFSSHNKAVAPKPTQAKVGKIITPDTSLAAKVMSVNTVGRFVVLNFPGGLMPKVDQPLFLYRDGLKTAELRVTGPQYDNNIVADLVSGDAKAGDSVRDE